MDLYLTNKEHETLQKLIDLAISRDDIRVEFEGYEVDLLCILQEKSNE